MFLTEQDISLLNRCFTLAERSLNYTLPNPKVGAVITNAEGKIIAEGWHSYFGGPHAEVMAFHQLPENYDFTDCSLYVSLEPCCHTQKKTPPCTSLIIEKKISKVYIATLDPNPNVSGNGLKILQNAGIQVFLASNEFVNIQKQINPSFFINQKFHRPLVTLKWAQSQNKVMGDQQKRITISHPYTQFFTHSLRASHQAILVGKNTVLIDKPQLNLRYAVGKNPIIILMDSHLSIDPQKYFPDRQGITVNLIKNETQGNWKYLQVENMLKWNEILTQLYSECQIGSILVEGGSAILNTILPTSYWDQAFFIVSPQSIETELPLYAPDCIPGAIEYVQNIRGNQIFKVTPIKVSRKEQNI